MIEIIMNGLKKPMENYSGNSLQLLPKFLEIVSKLDSVYFIDTFELNNNQNDIIDEDLKKNNKKKKSKN